MRNKIKHITDYNSASKFVFAMLALYFSFFQTFAQDNLSKRWQKGGLFYGRSPKEEVLTNRTRISKTFINPDGTYAAFFTGLTHYKDETGLWQDVNFNITENSSTLSSSYKYCNTTSEIKSYLPEKPGSKGVVMNYFGNEISFWNNPKMRVTAYGSIFYSEDAKDNSALIKENILTYPGIYKGMDEEMVVLENGEGIEDNIIINNIDPNLSPKGNNANLEFMQFIPLGNEWTVYNAGKEISIDFTSESFVIKNAGLEQGFVFNPIVVFDKKIGNKNLAFKLAFTPKDKIRAEEKAFVNHVVKGQYEVRFVKGGIEVYSVVPYNWFTETDRIFPVVFDPTVTVGSSASTRYGRLWDGYYTDTREEDILLSSDLTGAGLANGDNLTSIAVYLSDNYCTTVNYTGLKIRMQNTASTSFGSTSFLNTGYTNNYSGSQNLSITGWYTNGFSTNYSFNSAQNLLIDFSMDRTTFDCYFGDNGFYGWSAGANRSIGDYFGSDNGDPQTWTTAAGYSTYVPYMQIGYTRNPGSSYGIYGVATQTSATITDCQISATAGGGSATACLVCTPTDISYSSVNINSYPVISAGDATNNYKNCTAANMNMTKVTGGGTANWTGSAAPLTGSGNTMTVAYTAASLGRKNVVMNNGTGYTYTGFNNMLLDAPSPGTITSSAAGVCPGAATFTSSLGSAPGYTFAWSVPAVAGIGTTVTSPTASSTSITFTNSNTTATTVTVNLVVTSSCCGALTTVTRTITIYPLPAAPTTSGSGTICPGGSATLTASSTTVGASFEWYNASSGGTLLSSGASYTVSPTSTTTYYVQAINSDGCVNTTRTAVTETVTPTSAPTASNVSNCAPSDMDISISSPVAGATYTWYSGSCGGTLLQSSSSTILTVNVPAVQTNTYYVSVTLSGCNASSCQTVTATVTGAPASVTWTGAGTTGANNWFNAANWGGCLPTCNTDVIIPNSGGLTTSNPPDIGFSSAGSAECKSISIASGNTLSFSDPKAELDVCGDFTQNGTLTTNNKGKVVFKGSVTQNFTRAVGTTGDLYTVVLANTATPPLIKVKENSSGTNLDMNITSNLSFQTGIIYTEGARKVVIKTSTASAVSGGSRTGYVWGRLNRYVVNSATYDFPVGENPVTATAPNYPYENLNISFTTVTGLNDLTVKFENPSTDVINSIGTTTAAPGLPLVATEGTYTPVLNCGGTNTTTGVAGKAGIWTVIPNAGTATYNMTLSGTNYDNSTGGPGFSVLKRSTYSVCGTSPSWVLDGTWSTYSNAGNIVVGSRTGMSGFSHFAIGRTPVQLPIELVAFDITCVKSDAKLSWATGSETNNQYFTLERSCGNTDNFVSIATINGAGNSVSMKQYSYTDKEFPGGTCYYRLLQTDYDGKTTMFNTYTASCGLNNGFNLVNAIPNPAENELNVLFSEDRNETVYLTIVDVLGQQLFSKTISSEMGLNKVTIDLGNFAPASYFVKVNNGKKTFTKQILKL